MMKAQGLYDPGFEHDACGVGFLANINGIASHSLVEQGIQVLKNLLHRGATGADKNTGDGAGIMVQLPVKFLRRECSSLGIALPEKDAFGVGMFFMPQPEKARQTCREIVEKVTTEEGLLFLGWREVPTDGSVLGEKARAEQPVVMQGFVSGKGLAADDLERKLLIVRKQVQKGVSEVLAQDERFYVTSLSCRTLVYKGLMMADQVPGFYPDLCDSDLETAAAVVHQRYSTNTFPSWELAQPFRFLAHNGEINTLRGNVNWMRAREQNLASELFGKDIQKVVPVIERGGSDSACLDNTLELLVNGGRTLPHSMMMLIPQAWGVKYPMGPDLRGFFEYHAGLMEPWDGPAAVAFMDGHYVGALLDRNGLRPGRYTVTNDGFIIFASEAGVLDIPAEKVIEKGALRPGEMILVDFKQQRLMKDTEIKMRLARMKPYRRWVDENKIEVHGFFNAVAPLQPDRGTLFAREKMFGYSREDIDIILDTMATKGNEPVGSMGADQPLAVFSEKPQLLYWYFKQMFAQVTNPAIDPIREELVMSLMTFLGISDNILSELPQHARLVKLRHPILSNDDLERIRTMNLEDFACKTLDIGFPGGGSGKDLEKAIQDLCAKAEASVVAGHRILVLSDKHLPAGMAPIPALLAVSAVNGHLVDKKMRTGSALILETGEAREVMHMAVLLGYGASAINPYLAFEIIADLAITGKLSTQLAVAEGIERYVKALCKGLLKIMSKIGISTLRSYRSAQVFEALGLSSELVKRYFPGTPTRIEGIGIDDIAAEASQRFQASLDNDGPEILPSGGQYKFRKDGERHLWTPEAIALLQNATKTGNRGDYRKYTELINEQSVRQSTLRGMLNFKKTVAVPIEEVEPVSSIVKRFATSAMSFGSISREVHETLAVAMNRIGAMSNSGEGGEDPVRYKQLPNGDSRCSAVKQVASGRFGVTAEYLASARELQIKIAQGAKPGEGGQLPGHKVNAEIARVRHSTPGVTLISPPPHHDIYSIEDIAQLIYDLKNANPQARISVKLVSEAGVGTIAAGVAKGHADMILISGYDGGTGASPLSSIKHAGVPWELGLSESHQTLVLNGLRNRVRLQTDGQLKTGRDVVIAALLGAEEFGFATAPLVVCGCVMMRKCHNNTCPVGVATQDPELRKRFSGKPEFVINFFTMLAEEVRENMAALGFRTIDEMIGRSDVLEMNKAITFPKAIHLDYSRILARPEAKPDEVRCTTRQDHGLENSLDWALLKKIADSIDSGAKVAIELPIRNVNRTVGAIVSSHITKRYGSAGLPADTVNLRFSGAAGQSFGAFCTKGMTLELRGEANDYLGKGLSGARIVVKPYDKASYAADQNIIAGNVALYGATAGHVYINGRAGERFAIRNSGAIAVVEGVGDHGCEYMTGGRVVILGSTGVNFGAGMSGGIAYVYDETGGFDARCNLEMIDLEQVEEDADRKELRYLLEKHLEHTGSAKAAHILRNWDETLPHLIKVFPMEYKLALGRLSREDEATERAEIVND